MSTLKVCKERVLCKKQEENEEASPGFPALFVPTLLIISLVLSIICSETLEARSVDFYISPNGRDSNSGSSPSTAWETFNFAVPKLRPGDTLFLLDGTYNESMFIDCTRNAFNGTSEKPITVKAQNERKAFLQGNGVDPPFNIQNCSYWVIEGIRAESIDNPKSNGGSKGHVFRVNNSSNITLRRLLGSHTNRYSNTHVYSIITSRNILVEESEAYYFHRHGFNASNSKYVTFRRNYANSRGYADLSDGYKSIVKYRGDEGFVFYFSNDSIMENNISEGNYYIGDYGSRNALLGNISINNNIGFAFSHHCCMDSPSTDNTYVDNVAINSTYHGFLVQSQENTLVENLTSIDNRYDGFQANNKYDKWDVNPSIVIRNSLTVNNNNGFKINDSGDFTKITTEYLYSDNYSKDYLGGVRMNSTLDTGDPKIKSCKVYIPSDSPLKKAGKNGADIGANIIYRYEDGFLTSTKLWNQKTGQFPCGAAIPKVNDNSTFSNSACVNVNKRLNVGVNGCPIP